MFDGEMVKKIFPLKKNLDRNFWSKTKLDLEHFWSKTMLDLEHFWSKTKLDLENFWSKTNLALENFLQNFILPKALKCHV